jgi:hypothetical protein
VYLIRNHPRLVPGRCPPSILRYRPFKPGMGVLERPQITRFLQFSILMLAHFVQNSVLITISLIVIDRIFFECLYTRVTIY